MIALSGNVPRSFGVSWLLASCDLFVIGPVPNVMVSGSGAPESDRIDWSLIAELSRRPALAAMIMSTSGIGKILRSVTRLISSYGDNLTNLNANLERTQFCQQLTNKEVVLDRFFESS